jgi:hypothetical protein
VTLAVVSEMWFRYSSKVWQQYRQKLRRYQYPRLYWHRVRYSGCDEPLRFYWISWCGNKYFPQPGKMSFVRDPDNYPNLGIRRCARCSYRYRNREEFTDGN